MGENLYGAPWGTQYNYLYRPLYPASVEYNAPWKSYAGTQPVKPGNTNKPAKVDKSGTIMNIAGSALAFGQSAYGGFQYDRTADDLMQQAGRLSSSIGGIGYEMQNNIDANAEMQLEHKENVANTFKSIGTGALLGGSIGSLAGPIGTAIGSGIGAVGGLVAGLFGSGKRHAEARKAIARAEAKTNRLNNFNRDVAMTTKLQMDFGQQYGNQDDQILLAKHGKDAGTTGKNMRNGIVSTTEGLLYGPINALGHNGEPMRDKATGNGAIIRTGNGRGENAPLNVTSSTEIYGQDVDLDGITFEEKAKGPVAMLEAINNRINNNKNPKSKEIARRAAASTINEINDYLDDLGDRQKMMHVENYTGLPRYAKGKIGWTTNFIPSTIGMLLGIGQYFDAKNQSVYKPNTYVRNPYEQRAIAELDALRVNPYPITREMRNAESRMNYALNNSGGLSGAQKYIGRIANYNNLYNSIANMYGGIQEKNNAYRSAAAQAKLTAGAQDATNRMNALRADNDIYMKSHAAREAGMQTGLYNFMNYLTNYAKSENQRLMYNGMYDLYAQDRELEREKLRRG